ncbi:MAG: hypothetical protein RhofKO_10940 [Rhodothermales bacterium]
MSPDGIEYADTPVLDRLIREGASTMTARAVLPTSSSTNWASMIMGVGPEQHGITSNGWERDAYVLPAVVMGNEPPLFPSIFSLLHDQNPDAEIGAIYHWGGFGRLFEKKAVDHDVNLPTEATTTTEAVEYLNDAQPSFLFVHLDHVDGVGHGAGHGTPEYYSAVERADSLIGLVIHALEATGIADDALVIVSSDHGGIGKGHGGETEAEVEIPFILWGAGIKPNYAITHPVYTYDNAATAAYALGLEAPYAWIGRPVASAFLGMPEPHSPYQQVSVDAPVIAPGVTGDPYNPAGGLYRDRLPEVSLEGPADAALHYTLDGSEPTASSPQYSGPIQLTETTLVRARAIRDGVQSRVRSASYRLAPPGPGPIQWTYYELDEELERMPNLTGRTPDRTGRSHEFRLAPVPTREAQYAIVYETNLSIEERGTYTFYTFSDDGSLLYVNDQPVVDNNGTHGSIERSGTIMLAPGTHAVRVEYFQQGGGAWLDVSMAGPGFSKQVIPPDALR